MASLIADCYTKYIPQYAKGKLLDVGCGYVPMYGYYKKYIDSCICIDWDNSLHKNSFLDISYDISKGLPLEDGKFDTVICSDVLEHIFDPDKLLHEIARVLKDGGVLLMNVPFHYWEHEEPYDYYRYTQYWYKKELSGCNLEIIHLEKIGDSFSVKCDITGKLVPFKRIAGIYNYIMYNLFIKKRKNKNANYFHGYFIAAQKRKD